MTDSIAEQAATFGWVWLVLAVLVAPLIVYGLGRATERWTGPVTGLLWATVVAGGVFALAFTGHHDLPGVVAAFALATGLYADEIAPRVGRGLRRVWGALIKRATKP